MCRSFCKPFRRLLRNVITGAFLVRSLLVAGQTAPRTYGLPLPQPGAQLAYAVEMDFILPRGTRLPDTLDLSRYLPRAGDQKRQASCTAFTLGYALMSFNKNLTEGHQPDRTKAPDQLRVFSPGYLFNMVKQYQQPDLSADPCLHGVDFESTFTIAAKWGSCTMAQFGYDDSDDGCKVPVPRTAMNAAVFNKLQLPVALLHHRIVPAAGPTEIPFDPDQWKYHLMRHEPIAVGLNIDCSFNPGGEAASQQGVPFIWDITTTDCFKGGHAVLCYGYDDWDSTFLFFNSFGTAWGDSGHFKITYPALLANCTQAYVFNGGWDDSIGPPAASEAMRKAVEGPKVSSRIKVGTDHRINSLEVQVAKLAKDEEHMVVHFLDPISKELVRTIEFAPGVARSFIHDDKLWTFVYRKPSWVADLLGSSVAFTFYLDHDKDDLLRDHSEKHMARFRELRR